eukprot:gene13718-13840_t
MSLLATLPAPTRTSAAPVAAVQSSQSTAIVITAGKEPPPYPRRKGFVPRKQEDFGDGGAYPELPYLQYPLDMGRPDEQKGNKTLAVSVDIKGNANYDAILRQGARSNKIIHSGHQALVPKLDLMAPENLQRPDEEEIDKTAKETMEALNKRVTNKLAVQNPSTLPEQPGAATFIKYTPSQQGASYASGAKQRIIKMQDMPVDPLEPPKFRHTKVPRGTGSPPVPVMHSPPRPVTAEDQANWKIPPCISNWKNAKGYTIPLDKRLAADGRGLQALQVAESKARESTEMRKQVALEVASSDEDSDREDDRRRGQRRDRQDEQRRSGRERESQESAQEREERRRRDEIREERRRERERERRLETRDGAGPSKKSKLTRDRERDVGEKIALGMANVGATGEVQYDSRLFNQEQGMATGFGAEDSYNLYDKPLFTTRESNLFKPSKRQDDEVYAGLPGDGGVRTDKFRADHGFSGGAEGAAAGSKRTGGVEYEAAVGDDPFGLDAFVSEVDRGRRPLDSIGQRGGMAAGAGGGGHEGEGGSRRMQFTSGGR